MMLIEGRDHLDAYHADHADFNVDDADLTSLSQGERGKMLI